MLFDSLVFAGTFFVVGEPLLPSAGYAVAGPFCGRSRRENFLSIVESPLLTFHGRWSENGGQFVYGARHRGADGWGYGLYMVLGTGEDPPWRRGLRRPRPHRGRHRRQDDDRRWNARPHGRRGGREEHRLSLERPERPRRLLRPERCRLECLRRLPFRLRAFLPPKPAPGLRQGVRPLCRARRSGPQAPSRLAEA